jgi:pyridinium-3,5-biscarboxylic acid mononucleotide sulfurtransferase
MTATADKARQLRRILAGLEKVAVAYSGGTDSSYLLAASLDVLGPDNALALTADSPLTPRAELEEARALADQLGARHMVLAQDDLADEGIVSNAPDRCYHCKAARFGRLLAVARAEGIAHLLHGENADDVGDYRPGSRAAEELGVRAPLREAGLTKSEIRALSKERGLSTWDKPADACLASRFPYGTRLAPGALARVEAAEKTIRQILGLRHLRVRDHFPIARLEVAPTRIAEVIEPAARTQAVQALRDLGYLYVTLDLEGYRIGSLNDELES